MGRRRCPRRFSEKSGTGSHLIRLVTTTVHDDNAKGDGAKYSYGYLHGVTLVNLPTRKGYMAAKEVLKAAAQRL